MNIYIERIHKGKGVNYIHILYLLIYKNEFFCQKSNCYRVK